MSNLQVEFDAGLLRISFSDLKTANSFGPDVARELTLIQKTYRKSARGLLWVSGHPRIFCSGGNLKAYAKLTGKMKGVLANRKITEALHQFSQWPIPKAAALEGDCFGGGLEFLSTFQHRVASHHVLLGFWQRRVALSFGWGGFGRWREDLALHRIQNLSLSTRVIGAGEAMYFGLLDEVCAAKEAESRALRWLTQVMHLSPESALGVLQLGYQSERRIFEKLWWSSAHRAVLEKFR